MLWKEEKLKNRIDELEQYRYRDLITIPSMAIQLDTEGKVGERPPNEGEWSDISIGEYWRGRDLYAWLQTKVSFPDNWSGKQVVGIFNFGKTGGGHNSGFESLLYMNGEPFQGVDSNHKEVFFPGELHGETLDLTFRLWSGLEGGGEPKEQEHQIKKAEIGWLDEDVDDLFFTSKAIIMTLHQLDENQPERISLLNILDKSFHSIDWSNVGTDLFYESVKEARDILNEQLEELNKEHSVTIHCIGHTHIDVAWLWRLKHTREKAARSFSTVLRLMEKYPEYLFLQTQPQLYEYIKDDYPEIYEQMKERIKEKRWEVDGGMWLEADCNIPSGESLVRQLLYGTRFIKEEFGTESKYLWLPDVFGYSWALPQILKKSGINTFLTTKISWNQYNRMPHDTFKWRGIDGTEILSHFITTPYVNFNSEWRYDYNGHILPETVKGIWNAYRNKSYNNELLLSYGYGDGGGGVNREMLEMRRRLDQVPGLPNVKTSRADEYFEKLHQNVNETEEYVHTWDGELYLEYHRGTYTSQAENKRKNRKLELLYRETEFKTALESLLNRGWDMYPHDQLAKGWKIVLRNQFHDIIPGSSISEVYEDSLLEYQEAQQIAEQELSLLEESKKGIYTVYNSAPWEVTDIVKIPISDEINDGSWFDIYNNELEAQKSNNNWLIKVTIPSMGYTTVNFKEDEGQKSESSPFAFNEDGVDTPFYTIKWNRNGHLVQIFDKENNREVLPEDAKGNVFQVFEDKPLRWDAWDIDIFYQEKMREVQDLDEIKLIDNGSLAVIIQFKWKYFDSTITQNMSLYSNHKRIEFNTTVDWNEQQQLLKVAFPVDVRATEATYDIQFGNVKRPTHWNTSWDWARFETVGHQWADLSEMGYGVSLLNDCKYGHDIKDNMMRLTLIKTSNYPEPNADIGTHVFSYALYPHAGDWLEANTVQEAWSLNNPCTYLQKENEKDQFSLFQVSKEHIMIDAVKKAEDSNQFIIRLHDYSGGRGEVEMTSELNIKSWQECDLLERGVGIKQNSSVMKFNLNPYEIKTFIIDFNNTK